jgi:hypothetical protein
MTGSTAGKAAAKREDFWVKLVLFDGASVAERSFARSAGTGFDATVHRFSRWAGYAALGAAYAGIGYFFVH